ncbi:MAG: GreA/GreB family elongation factor [Chitinophagaceae bacterium]
MLKTNTTATKSKVILLREDYDLLNAYFQSGRPTPVVNEKQNFKSLSEELSKATILTKNKFPEDVIRLNSTAIIKDTDTNRVITVTIVMPEQADVKKNKVSVLAPVGTALIGFKKGQQVVWPVPSGTKKFMIMEVYNSPSIESHSVH